jgi:hypothetical protein
MKKTTRKILILMVGVFAATALVAGCQEEQKQTSAVSNDQTNRLAEVERMSKLMAAQNVDLRKQLKEQERLHAAEMQRQRTLNEKDIQKQTKLLEKCRQENKALEEASRDDVESYMSGVLGPVVDENDKLSKENEALKVQVQNLQDQIDRLKAE